MRDTWREERIQQLCEAVREQIRSGQIRPGERLEGERVFARRYKISRMAAKHALNLLEKELLIYRVQGRGSFVQGGGKRGIRLNICDSMEVQNVNEFTGGENDHICSRVLGVGRIEACAGLCEKLGIHEDESIVCIHRAIYVDGKCAVSEYNYLPERFLTKFSEREIAQLQPYELLRRVGWNVTVNQKLLRIVSAGKKEGSILGMRNDEKVYMVENRGITGGGVIVEYSESYVHPGRAELFGMADRKL